MKFLSVFGIGKTTATGSIGSRRGFATQNNALQAVEDVFQRVVETPGRAGADGADVQFLDGDRRFQDFLQLTVPLRAYDGWRRMNSPLCRLPS